MFTPPVPEPDLKITMNALHNQHAHARQIVTTPSSPP
ncbi:hypothetical protein FHR33_003272 [Nonomuraea dietziae]|uniref:Uncharacterized protein n=1 Tax=Nonomuraea dietziae TaxID=65515 RepID=A0A7W5VGL6_9ACTN|nr:hypothetical protein [Nonomuraea dietziae]